MNRDEDVLFLYLTSHGSDRGLALSFPRDSGFRSATLTPSELASMLDESGIRFRIVVVAGCESGVFLRPLANDKTIIATAAADDRESYGCAMGNEQTDFGRALFSDHLGREPTIAAAIAAAITQIDDEERKDGRTPSRPQLVVGKEIAAKLGELERTLAGGASPPSQ